MGLPLFRVSKDIIYIKINVLDVAHVDVDLSA